MLTQETTQALETILRDNLAIAEAHPNSVVSDAVNTIVQRITFILSVDATADMLSELIRTIDEESAYIARIIEVQESQRDGSLLEVNKEWVLEILNRDIVEADTTALKFLIQSNGESTPSSADIVESVLAELNNEQVNYLRQMRSPKFYLLPDAHHFRLIDTIQLDPFLTDHSTTAAAYTPGVTPDYEEALAEISKSYALSSKMSLVTSYHFIIVETDLNTGDQPGAYDAEYNSKNAVSATTRLEAFTNAHAPKGIWRLDALGGLIVCAHGARVKQPAYQDVTAIIDGAGDNNCSAHWNKDRAAIELDDLDEDELNPNARIPTCIQGRIYTEQMFSHMMQTHLAELWAARKNSGTPQQKLFFKKFTGFLATKGITTADQARQKGYTLLADEMEKNP